MTFLQLVQRARQEMGIAGNGPTTVTGQTGEIARLVNWVNQAWQEIQMERDDWDFLRTPVTFYTSANKQAYTVGLGEDIDLEDFGKWRNDSFRSYLRSAGVATEVILSQYYDYGAFRDFYLLGSRKLVRGRPLYFTIEPATRSILLGFTPDNVYVVSGEYYRTPQELTLDDDVPLMPARYHMAIVFKAMMKYGLFEAAQEQLTAGQQGFAFYMNKLRAEQAPMILQGQSLL